MRYERPQTIEQLRLLYDESRAVPGLSVQFLAGGQSLLPAMSLGLNQPDFLIDLQEIQELGTIELIPSGETLRVGAMVTHGQLSNLHKLLLFSSRPEVFKGWRWIENLATRIADQQIRNRGTIGGSIANNDPSACWPAAILASNALLRTDRRTIRADDFFQGMFGTALQEGELLLSIDIPRLVTGHYAKFEQKASRFALVGVVIAVSQVGVRVAVNGLGFGVCRWPAAEQHLSELRLENLSQLDPYDGELEATTDIHATAEYRLHLAKVMLERAVIALKGKIDV